MPFELLAQRPTQNLPRGRYAASGAGGSLVFFGVLPCWELFRNSFRSGPAGFR